jgi:hypothetical protein
VSWHSTVPAVFNFNKMKIEKVILDSYSILLWSEEMKLIYEALKCYEQVEAPGMIGATPLTPSTLYLLQRMTTELKIVLTPEA